MISATTQSEEEQWADFVESLSLVAILQGRIAYCLMSIHAVNPNILNSFLNFDLFPYLWANMIYGITVLIYSRASLRRIATPTRLTFGILGSLMFNHSSMLCFDWLHASFPDRPYICTFMGFFSGRFMMVHLLAFLYHMDTRSNTPGTIIRRDYTFETMYI